jgi:hypothetical protein
MIGRTLLGLVSLALASFVALALIGLWDRYSQEAAALGFEGVYERYLASQVGFSHDSSAYRTAVELNRRRQAGNAFPQTTPLEE